MREVVVRGWRIRSPCWWMSLFALFFRMGAMDVRRCTMCERLKEGGTLDVSGLTRWYAGYQMRCAVAVDEVGGLCVCC